MVEPNRGVFSAESGENTLFCCGGRVARRRMVPDAVERGRDLQFLHY